MAVVSAGLSSRTAPRTERSASGLLGRGFSRVASAGIFLAFRLRFAYISLLFHLALKHEGRASSTAFGSGSVWMLTACVTNKQIQADPLPYFPFPLCQVIEDLAGL